MNSLEIIEKKRDNKELSPEEIRYFLHEYQSKRVSDYQMSAFLMCVYFNGLNEIELSHFTQAMTESGERIEIPKSARFIVDKHSSGGVGDKTSITLAPLLASLGLGVAKLTGKGLGHTGGTIDKFESVPGFHFMESVADARRSFAQCGIALLGYTDSIVPLDKEIYTLRDVTATVPSIPLIASSIMSKKLAMSSDLILLDVKVGKGSFMREFDRALLLANTMLQLGSQAKRSVACVLSNMNQPLGYEIGNANEFIEAVETLKGRGPADFVELICTLAAVAQLAAKKVESLEEGKDAALQVLESGSAVSYLKEFISLNHGNSAVIDDYHLLPQPKFSHPLHATQSGYVHGIDSKAVGHAAMLLGAGRMHKEDSIDHAVGISLKIKINDAVEKNSVIGTIYANDAARIDTAQEILYNAILIKEEYLENTEDMILKIVMNEA